jgi:membrane-anchored protein YejM (alkaline phosphatase superfamily)
LPIISRRDAVKYGDLLPLGEAEHQAKSDNNSSLKYPLKELEFNQPTDFNNPNILIIFLESWRFDAMNEEITPNIYNLSQKSSVFNNHLCSGNSTVAGVFGFFYGIHPTYWTSVKANSTLIDNPVFIDVLKDNQYSFAVFAKSNFNRHKIKDTMFRGIDVDESFGGGALIDQDAVLSQKLISFIREQSETQKPYLAFAFFKSNHFPYQYPKEDSIFLPAGDINLILTDDDTDPEHYMNDYRNSTHYVDALIGEVLRQVDSLGGMEKTVIVITTDHADELNDNRANYWGHGSNFTKYQNMVPLIIYMPEREPRQINYPTTHVDIVPTLMRDVYGCSNDFRDYSNGRYLFDELSEPRPFVVGNYVNHAFIFEDNVYEIYPMYTKKYKLDNVNAKASPPSPQMLKTVMEEINRFYYDTDKVASD